MDFFNFVSENVIYKVINLKILKKCEVIKNKKVG